MSTRPEIESNSTLASESSAPNRPNASNPPGPRQLILHLVHGTWPNGTFKKVNRFATDVWYHDQSELCRNIVDGAERPVQLRQFFWSGNNTFSARQKAAEEFTLHLNASLKDSPDSDHAILAHSHGGTVAMHAIYWMANTSRYPGNLLKAVICMASPFTYVTRATEGQREQAGDAITSVITVAISASILILFPGIWNSPWLPLWFLAGFSVVYLVCNIAVQMWLALKQPTRLHFNLPDPEINFPFYLIRATRDEAAMAIGLTQSVNAIFAKLFSLSEPDGSFKNRRIKRNILGAFFTALIGLPFATLTVFAGLALGWKPVEIFIVFCLVSSIVWPFFAIFSYAMLCLSTGMFKFSLWGNVVIEADGAPPNNDSHFFSIADIDSLDKLEIRHGIYLLPEVQRVIIKIINSLK